MGTIKGDESAWQSTKIGAGCIPIETEEGWLVIYHGVINTCNGFVYRMGCALLDLEQPWKVLKRTKNYILAPHEIYECMGDVPNRISVCCAYGRRNRKNCNLLWLCRYSYRTCVYDSK